MVRGKFSLVSSQENNVFERPLAVEVIQQISHFSISVFSLSALGFVKCGGHKACLLVCLGTLFLLLSRSS